MHELPIGEEQIRELARQARHCNVFPIFLPNEYFREEDKHPVRILLRRVVPEAADYIAALTDHEFRDLIAHFGPGASFMLGDNPHRATQAQRERIALYYLASEIQRIYLSFSDVVSASLDGSEVLKIYPELRELFDKDGLLHIDDRFTLHDGGVEYRDHILHYHQFLRRGFTANPNFDFLGLFARFYDRTKGTNKFRIAIDHQRIMPLAAYLRLMEMDAWFGPSFDRDKLDDASVVGLTIVKRNQNSLFRLNNSLDRTEFYWSYRDYVKTLEIEEISGTEARFEHFHLNRYLHAERDTRQKILRHVDGAVKVYLVEQYAPRFAAHMPREPKSHAKVKLWRIDGDVDVDTWMDLTAFFFKANEMIIEYFDPAKFEAEFEERVRDFEKWKAKQTAKTD